jgi:hypothetical protein
MYRGIPKLGVLFAYLSLPTSTSRSSDAHYRLVLAYSAPLWQGEGGSYADFETRRDTATDDNSDRLHQLRTKLTSWCLVVVVYLVFWLSAVVQLCSDYTANGYTNLSLSLFSLPFLLTCLLS